MFLTPALAKIARVLKISESLAGVTFLTYGNGAADVVSSIAASGLSATGIYLSSSGIIGALAANSLFLSPLVVILSKKAIELPLWTYGRDVLFLIITLTTLLLYFIIGSISWVMALILLILYFTYITVCVVMERLLKKSKEVESVSTSAFEEDLAQSQTRAEATGEEIVRREGAESFVKYTGVSLTSFLIPSVEEEKPHKESKVILVSSSLARRIRHRIWGQAMRTLIKM